MRKVDPQSRYDAELNCWVRKEGDIYVVGLTDWAQNFLKSISRIYDLPTIRSTLRVGQVFCTTESDKSITEHMIPVSGMVDAINGQLTHHPSLVNSQCYGQGWILRLREVNENDWHELKSSTWYAQEITSFFNK